MARSKTNPQRLAQLQGEASEVAGRRLMSLGGKSAMECNLMLAAWGWEKVLTAQRVGWEVSCALWSSALTFGTKRAGERLVQASLRPIERKVRSNRTRLRAGR